MTPSVRTLACTAALATLPALTQAESLASSAASSASITASSASQSLDSASNSSRRNTAQAGEYRVDAVAAAAEPGKVQLRLTPLLPTETRQGFVLTLPQAALQAQDIGAGTTVSVRERPYGYEFARADTRTAFFLVLADDWHHELDPRPLRASASAS